MSDVLKASLYFVPAEIRLLQRFHSSSRAVSPGSASVSIVPTGSLLLLGEIKISPRGPESSLRDLEPAADLEKASVQL